jgi:hypothetical protein
LRKNWSKTAAWALLFLGLLLAGGSFALRWQNETDNRTIVNIADYREFHLIAAKANRNIDDIVVQLKALGINAIGVKEVSMRDMATQGDIEVLDYGKFLAEAKTREPELLALIQSRTAEAAYIGEENLVAVSPSADTSAFIAQRLSARYLSESAARAAGQVPEFFAFSWGGNDYFIMNVELTPLERGKDAKADLDVQLGYDENLIQRLQARGFELVLRPGISKGTNDAFWAEYDHLLTTYGIKTIIFSNQVFAGTPEHVTRAETLIEKYGVIIGIIETSQQIKYLEQAGLDPLMERIDYQVNRVYSTSNDEFVTETRDRYYRWVRGVVDRSIRLMYIVPFKDYRWDASKNLDDTLSTIADFTATMTDKAYPFAGHLEPLNTDLPSRANRSAIALSLAAAGILYLAYLFRLRGKTVGILLAIGLILSGGMNWLPLDWSKVYALAAAILYPSLSSLLLLIYLKQYKDHSLGRKIFSSLGIVLLVNALGMYTIVAALADIRFIMNVKIFSGVKLAFLLPLLLFALNYLLVFGDEDRLLENIYKNLLKHPTYLFLLLAFIGLAMGYVVLARSGNNSSVGVSQLEIRVREFLEIIFLARPRFKEIILGYPCLLVMIYLYHRYRKNILLLILGFGVMMGSISMTNSFCHVFTSVAISAHRTLAGLLTGGVLALCALAGFMLLEWLFLCWYHQRAIDTGS